MVSALQFPSAEQLGSVLIALALSAVLGFIVSECYRFTNREIAHSQSFMHTIVLTVIIACIVTRTVDQLATAFLAGGALAVLRFRTVMRDAREFSFIFLAIGAGIGVGTGNYAVVVFGTLFCAALTYCLHQWQYGRHRYPPYKLSIRAPLSDVLRLREIINSAAVKVDFIGTQKLSEDAGTFKFEILLKNDTSADALLHSLKSVVAANDISLMPWKRTFGTKDSDG